MRIQPRQEILSIWKSITKWSASVSGEWNWGGRHGQNSISDAEQLQCLLLPPTKLSGIGFGNPELVSADVRRALEPLGNPTEIPQRVVRLIADFLAQYTDDVSGLPVFPGGTYFTVVEAGRAKEITDGQRAIEVVDSYATSVTLTVAMIRFLRDYRTRVRRKGHLEEIEATEEAAQRRLTAAMVGLQRSFAVNVFRADSPEGQVLCRMVGQSDEFVPTIVTELRRELEDIVVGLRELGMSEDLVADLTENPDLLFECGWSWGTVRDSAVVKTQMGEFSHRGYAEPAPYLYFTVVAVDGIAELFTGPARMRGLLNEEQQQLARTLMLQWELARRYWATVATMGGAGGGRRWPLEDIPWRTTDQDETDYYSVLVTSLVLDELVDRRAPDADLERICLILEELADRGRITRRPLVEDPGLELHHPGTRIALVGSELETEGAPRLAWLLADLATLVLGRALNVVQNVNDHELRARLLLLADRVWEHVNHRRLSLGPGAGLWDQPANVYRALPRMAEDPSWYFTLRVVQCLATATELIQDRPPYGPRLADMAAELLSEAEYAFDLELLRGSDPEIGPVLGADLRKQSIRLDRARRLIPARPGTAVALLSDVLRALDRLSAAREPEVGE